MNVKTLTPEVRQIWRVIKFVQITLGFSFGLYIFTYGPYLYENFGESLHGSNAMILTTAWFAIGLVLEALLEVPAGAIGDAIGRKRTVLWSLLCRILFFLFLALVSITSNVSIAFTIAIIANIAFAFSYTFLVEHLPPGGWIVCGKRAKDLREHLKNIRGDESKTH